MAQHSARSTRSLRVSNETWLVCGGRDFTDRVAFDNVMLRIASTYGLPRRVVHGDALGADTLANNWGYRMGLGVCAVRAQWRERDGTKRPLAGAERNQQMLDTYKPDRVIAFPTGGPGTRDMMERAQSQGFLVMAFAPSESTPE